MTGKEAMVEKGQLKKEGLLDQDANTAGTDGTGHTGGLSSNAATGTGTATGPSTGLSGNNTTHSTASTPSTGLTGGLTGHGTTHTGAGAGHTADNNLTRQGQTGTGNTADPNLPGYGHSGTGPTGSTDPNFAGKGHGGFEEHHLGHTGLDGGVAGTNAHPALGNTAGVGGGLGGATTHGAVIGYGNTGAATAGGLVPKATPTRRVFRSSRITSIIITITSTANTQAVRLSAALRRLAGRNLAGRKDWEVRVRRARSKRSV